MSDIAQKMINLAASSGLVRAGMTFKDEEFPHEKAVREFIRKTLDMVHEEEAMQKRRFAILQAAATIYAANRRDIRWVDDAVALAFSAIESVERREKGETKE